jgi:itaconate CoA-transferase
MERGDSARTVFLPLNPPNIRMYQAEYKAKLTTPAEAVKLIPARGTLATGDRELYDFLNDNSSMELYPVDFVNDPNIIGENDRTISINGFLEVSLDGEVNSEAIGAKQYSAPGGQLDFVRGAQRSKDGKSILTAYSTASKGTISRIVAKVEGPATDPRADTQYVVTEYGVANLRGKSTAQRIEALIAIAHPNFRSELMRQAREMGYL